MKRKEDWILEKMVTLLKKLGSLGSGVGDYFVILFQKILIRKMITFSSSKLRQREGGEREREREPAGGGSYAGRLVGW